MADYQFGGSLYRSQRDMLDSLVHQWLDADMATEAREMLAEASDATLATECTKHWELDMAPDNWPDEVVEPSHMQEQGYDVDDLEEAFARLRESLTGGSMTDAEGV